MRYLIRFVNVFGRDYEAADLEAARAICQRNSFEAVVIDTTTGAGVYIWSPISGWQAVR